jgi:protein SCO1
MSKPQKIVAIVLWVVAVSAMLIVLVRIGDIGWSEARETLPPGSTSAATLQQIVASPAGQVLAASGDAPDTLLPVFYAAPKFQLTDQDSQPMGSAQLRGHPWVADFFFTTCASLCPIMSAHMADLQSELPEEVKLVSFSVDPQHDDPATLKAYAQRYHAENGRWFFLTGDEKIQDAVIRGMKIGLIPANGANPIQHDEHFVLVDSQGKVRGVYDSLVPQLLQQLVRDARTLCANDTAAAGAGG